MCFLNQFRKTITDTLINKEAKQDKQVSNKNVAINHKYSHIDTHGIKWRKYVGFLVVHKNGHNPFDLCNQSNMGISYLFRYKKYRINGSDLHHKDDYRSSELNSSFLKRYPFLYHSCILHC